MDTHQKQKKTLTNNWKIHLWVFLFFFLFFFLCYFVFLFCFFLEGLRVRWGGPKTLNPPYYYHFVFFLPFFAPNRKNPVFPLEKGISCLFWGVSVCFSLTLLGLPPFQFLSLSLVILFLLLAFLFAWFWLFVFLSFFFFLLCFCFMKRETSKHSIAIFSWCVFLVSCCFFKSVFLIFAFPDFKLCFLFNINVLVAKQAT